MNVKSRWFLEASGFLFDGGKMSLFEEKNRVFLGPKSRIDGSFEYLDRSGRSEARRVREFIETWLERYPIEHRTEMEIRLRDRNDRNFASASFELILFACVSSLGYSVQVHPRLPNGNNKRPDFLVRRAGGEDFYLEAVLASEFDAAEIAARRRTNVVLEALEGINSPNFFIGIIAKGNPDTPPPTKKLKRDIQDWLKSLDPDSAKLSHDENGTHDLPTYSWEHNGWSITFKAIPKRPEARGKHQRVIGFQFDGARGVNSWEPIRDAIKQKGSRYGELDKPLLVAVNSDSISVDEIDEMQALFGEEEFIFQTNGPGSEPIIRRKPNGAWHGPKGAQFKRVSGAWLFHSLNCWNPASRAPTLYFNPWANKPLPNQLTALKHARSEDIKMIWKEGIILGDILGLSANWPGDG